MTIPDDTIAWLRQAAAAGQADAQVMQELLRRIEALEQRPIAGAVELADEAEEPAEDQPQTLHSVALQMVDMLARLGVLLEIRETLKRAIREPMAPAAIAGPVATDEELHRIFHVRQLYMDSLRDVYNLGREHGASQTSCPHIRSSDEGTSYCALAQQGNSSASLTGSPAPAGGLVERVTSRVEHAVDADQELEWLALESAARGAICEVVAWLREIGNHGSARDLEQEASR